MPKYDYECSVCGYMEEIQCKYDDREELLPDHCPDCKNSGTLGYVISGGAGLLFNGPGFYATEKGSQQGRKGPMSQAEYKERERKGKLFED